ncbi:hypothetical protein [Paenibacillus sp. Pae108]|uniref:hypothetical protein n=1 Tax=Paenibacillus sp. Pae108 TaxID=2926019 RepID=UPI002117BF36|nr:hypothetical protein [Paenibacillus sp. Pae108]
MAINGAVGAIYQTSGPSVEFSQKELTNSGDNMRYYITEATSRYWDNSAPVTIEKSTNGGSSWVIVTTGFTIEHAGGHVVFDTDQGNAIFRATGKKFNTVFVGGGFNWSLDIEVETMDSTTFASSGWREFSRSFAGFSGSFEQYWTNGEASLQVGQATFIIILYVDSGTSKSRYEGYAIITSDSIETASDSLVQETIDFNGNGKIYYRAG